MNGDRGLSPVVGSVMLFAIGVALVGITAMGVTSVAASSTDAAVVHGEGRFAFQASENGMETVEVRPQVVVTRGSTFHLSIEGTEVREWGGTTAVTLSCLESGDEVSIHTTKAGTREHFQSWTAAEPTDCALPAHQRDDHVVVDGTPRSV